MSTDLSKSEIDRRYNHWDENDSVDRCKCGSFVSKPDPHNGEIRYYCDACERWRLEYVA